MAEMYKNIKTGVKAELIEINEKTKSVTLKKADGKYTGTTIGPFQKYWKKIEDGEPEKQSSDERKAEKAAEVAKKKEEKAVEAKKPEPVKAEKAPKEEKPKKEKKERVKKSEVNVEARKALIEKLSKKYPGIKIDDNYFTLRVGDKIAFAGAFGANDVRVCAISKILPEKTEFKIRKNALDAVIRVQYSESDSLFTLIKYAEDNFKDSDILKKKRKEKVEKSKKEKSEKNKKVEKEEK